VTERLIRYLVLPALLVAAVPVAHLLPGLDVSAVEQHMRDGLHVAGFAAVAWLLFELVPFAGIGRALTAFGAAILIGFLAELSQKLAGHFFNPFDIARDAVGAGLAVLARLLWDLGTPGITRIACRGVAAVLVAAVLAPFTYWGWGWLSERMKAPVIVDFEGRFAGSYYVAMNATITLTENDTSDGRFAEIMLSGFRRSGIRLTTATRDWRRWDWLAFDAEIAAGQESVVSIHLNDYDSIGHFADTQAGMITVTPGKSSYRVSVRDIIEQAGRADDAGNICQVAVFARSRNRGTVLYLDNLRLE
jgi:hypothetical protein